MVQTIQAKNANLRDLIDNFGIQLVRDNQFFREWQDNLPAVTDLEKQLLDRVVDGFINLLNYPPVLEDVVRMSVLDPLLFIGGFYPTGNRSHLRRSQRKKEGFPPQGTGVGKRHLLQAGEPVQRSGSPPKSAVSTSSLLRQIRTVGKNHH